MLKPHKRPSRKGFDSPKAARTFGKRNDLPQREHIPSVEEFEDDYSENDLLIDSLFEQTDEELDIVSDYIYGDSLNLDFMEAEKDYYHERRMESY